MAIINGYCSPNCPSGFYLVGFNCIACPNYCRTCVSQFNCTSCNITNSSSLFLFTNRTISTCISFCPTAHYMENGQCLRCLSTCSVCLSAANCSQCLLGFALVNNICVNPTNITICPTNCQNCHGLNCLTCIKPFILYINSITVASSCVSTCPSGFYPGVQSCLSCNSSCVSCVNTANNCSKCLPGLFLYDQKCLNFCPLGHYANTLTQICSDCPLNCIVCLGDQCFKCLLGFSLYNNKCYQNCPVSTYQSYSVQQCFDCPSECLTCLNVQNCTSCKTGFLLYNQSCTPNCPQTTYTFLTT